MRTSHAEAGTTLIELAIAMSIVVLLVVLGDAVLITAIRSAKRAELAADVQQNGRLAIDRIAREIRESGSALADEISITDSLPARSAIVFKSARLRGDAAIFCLYARMRAEPLFHRDCYSFAGMEVALPPYGSIAAGSPLGSYRPIWQRYIGYYLVPAVDGLHDLRRVAVSLERPDAELPDPATLRGGETIATQVESLEVARSGAEIRMTLKTAASGVVLGSAVPPEAILLSATVRIRN